MATEVPSRLRSFGIRSLITHSIMAAALVGAVVSGFFVGGEVGRISFVALLNFTAGLWICQSIHSLGNPEYRGLLNVVRSDDE